MTSLSRISAALAVLLLFAPTARSEPSVKAPGVAVSEAEPSAVVEPASPAPAPDGDPDVRLLLELKEAEAHYKKGVRLFRKGQTLNGRANLKKAFAILIASLEEETLPTELMDDFLSMLEKVRTWEAGEDKLESPSDLDIPEEELKAAAPGGIPPPGRREKHAVPIDPDNPITQKFIKIYTGRRRAGAEKALARSGRYREMIHEALDKAGMPRELFWLVMAESEYKLWAVSRSGAAGIWQFMPFTGRRYGLEVSYWIDERFHPEKATHAAIRYLSDLYEWFGDWHLAMAAYNRGEGGIGRDLQFSRSTDFSLLSARGALPRQTHNYVPKIMACALIGENPERYGLRPEYEDPEPYDVVKLDRDLDLGIAAKAAGTTKETIRRLNPHIRAWCTPKNRPGFELRIPRGTKERFTAALAKVKDWNPGPQIVRYKVRRGDILGRIARKYRTTVRSIARLNNIRNPRLIRPGKVLKIRPGKAFYRKK